MVRISAGALTPDTVPEAGLNGIYENYPVGRKKVPSWKKICFQLEKIFSLLCCFPNNLEYFFVCFLFFINQLPISPIFYLFS